MKWFIDTTIISRLMRGNPEVKRHWARVPVDDLHLPAVVLAEGLTGAYRVGHDRYRTAWETIAQDYVIIPFDLAAAEAYARLRADLEARGCMIGHRDCQIAATALAYARLHPDEDITLVTDNVAEFSRVAGLRVENWVPRP